MLTHKDLKPSIFNQLEESKQTQTKTLKSLVNNITPDKYKLLEAALTSGFDEQKRLATDELSAELHELETLKTALEQYRSSCTDELNALNSEVVAKLGEVCKANNQKAWEQAGMMVAAKVLGSAVGFFYEESAAKRRTSFIEEHKPLPEWSSPLAHKLKSKKHNRSKTTQTPEPELTGLMKIKQMEKRHAVI